MGLYQGDKPLSSIGKSPAAYAKDAGYTGTDDNFYTALANMPEHLSNQENPHGTTASQVGADVAGAANEALNSAKAYTDQIVAGVVPGDGSKESPADSDSIFIYDNSDSGKPKKTLISKLVELFNNTFYTKTETNTLLQNKPDKNAVVNPNLADNWYFAHPVNQRNVSGTIDTVGYFLDRWKLISGNVTIGSNGITLNGTIVQIFETAVGTDVTASALTTEGVVEASYDNNSKTLSLTGTGQTFVAVKLELGTTQTLAHQDVNGNWVLNEIPNYGEQLARCQRYCNAIKAVSVYSRYGYGIGTGDSIYVFVPINVPLRAVPTAITMVGDFTVWNGVTPHPATFKAFDSIATNGVSFSVTSSDMTAGQVFQFIDSGTGNSAIILDANL